MDYTNTHGVHFKVHFLQHENYLVKYYPRDAKFPRVYHRYQCANDETRAEMMFLLSKLRLCQTCGIDLLGYRDERNSCKTCLIKTAQESKIDISECPVCLQTMLSIDGTKKSLVCRHALCETCMKRMAKSTATIHYDQAIGPYVVKTIKCPLCRDTGHYDYLFRAVQTNSTI